MSVFVVTVTRNDLVGLRATCESLRRQDYIDWGHVVMDGGSTHGSIGWLTSNPTNDVVGYFSEPDERIHDVLNKWMALAGLGLVVCMKSSDVFAADDVLTVVLADYAAEGWSWAYGDALTHDVDGMVSVRRFSANDSWFRETLWDYDICHQAVSMRSSFLRHLGGFNSALSISADYQLITRGGPSQHRFWRSRSNGHQARTEMFSYRCAARSLDRMLTVVSFARAQMRSIARQVLHRIRGRGRLTEAFSGQ